MSCPKVNNRDKCGLVLLSVTIGLNGSPRTAAQIIMPVFVGKPLIQLTKCKVERTEHYPVLNFHKT